jgi:hypothetical protein
MMRRTWTLRAGILVLSGVALFAQSSGGSDAGLFVVKAGGEPERLPGVISQPHQKGVAGAILKSTLTAGLLGGGPKMEFTFDGPAAATRVDPSSSFLFRLTQTQQSTQAGSMPQNINIGDGSSRDPNAMFPGMFDSPPLSAKKADDFVLARFTVMDGARHLDVSQSRSGTLKTDASVATKADKSGPDTYKVQSKSTLEPGEYAFFYGGPGGGGQFWTFGVDAK